MPTIRSSGLAPLPIEEVKVRAGASKHVMVHQFLINATAEEMERRGYGERRRSRWVEEAISGLILHDPALMLGSSGSKAFGREPDPAETQLVPLKVVLSLDLLSQAKDLVRMLRRQHPDGEGSLSDVVRYALIFRLRYPDHYPASHNSITGDDLIARALAVTLDPVLRTPYPAAESSVEIATATSQPQPTDSKRKARRN